MSTPKTDYEDIRVEVERALELRKLDQLKEARELLEALALRRPRAAFVLGTLGGIHFELGDIESARSAFQQAVDLSPRSETASLGLFHSLYEEGKRDAAFGEMLRFLTSSYSDEYAQIIPDLRGQLGEKLYGQLLRALEMGKVQ